MTSIIINIIAVSLVLHLRPNPDQFCVIIPITTFIQKRSFDMYMLGRTSIACKVKYSTLPRVFDFWSDCVLLVWLLFTEDISVRGGDGSVLSSAPTIQANKNIK